MFQVPSSNTDYKHRTSFENPPDVQSTIHPGSFTFIYRVQYIQVCLSNEIPLHLHMNYTINLYFHLRINLHSAGRCIAHALRVRGEHALHPQQLCLLQQGRDRLPHPRGREVGGYNYVHISFSLCLSISLSLISLTLFANSLCISIYLYFPLFLSLSFSLSLSHTLSLLSTSCFCSSFPSSLFFFFPTLNSFPLHTHLTRKWSFRFVSIFLNVD